MKKRGKGILAQMQNKKLKYKNLSLQTIKQAVGELFNKPQSRKESDIPIGKLSDERKAQLRLVYPKFILESLGEDLYHLGDGCITGVGGWNKFEEAVKKECLKSSL